MGAHSASKISTTPQSKRLGDIPQGKKKRFRNEFPKDSPAPRVSAQKGKPFICGIDGDGPPREGSDGDSEGLPGTGEGPGSRAPLPQSTGQHERGQWSLEEGEELGPG